MTLHLRQVPNCLECMEFYLYSHCTSASCLLRQRCSFSLYIQHTGKHYHKRRVKRQSPPPHIYCHRICCICNVPPPPQDHVGVKMFLMIIFQGVHHLLQIIALWDSCLEMYKINRIHPVVWNH